MKTDNKDKQLAVERNDYAEILRHAVAVIEHARAEIAKHVNGYVSTAYWEIGQMLHERKIESGYGDSVVKRLSADLKERYPKMGVSPRNLWYMKRFYLRYCGSDAKVQRSVALLPWSHNVYLLNKNLSDDAVLYYAREAVAKGWNRGLRCLVAVDLKIGAFKPEYAGKMNYYLSLLDRLERGAEENRSIGIILCAEKDRVEVELALEDMGKPIGVADYQLIVPKEKLQKVLVDEIKAFSEEKEKHSAHKC